MKYLGIDYSARRIGLALGEDVSRLAVPLLVIEGGSEGERKLCQLIKDESIDACVVGIPLPAKGQDAYQYHRVRDFIARLRGYIAPRPLYEVDESFTTRSAVRLQEEADGGRTAETDALAAMLILQEFFDTQA